MNDTRTVAPDILQLEWPFIARWWLPVGALLLVIVIAAWLAGPDGAPIVRLEFEDGSEYIGFVAHGVPDGEGTLVTPRGEIYTGRFVDGRRAGFGTCHYANGDIYFGEWVDDQRSGQGTLSYASGDTHSGAWREDEPDGFGRRVLADGQVVSGEWTHGLPPRAAVVTYAEEGRVGEGTTRTVVAADSD